MKFCQNNGSDFRSDFLKYEIVVAEVDPSS